MLIIYGAFRLGGIETFFLRLAKERFSSNLVTKFLFLSVRSQSDEIYIKQLEQFASVIFLPIASNSSSLNVLIPSVSIFSKIPGSKR